MVKTDSKIILSLHTYKKLQMILILNEVTLKEDQKQEPICASIERADIEMKVKMFDQKP